MVVANEARAVGKGGNLGQVGDKQIFQVNKVVMAEGSHQWGMARFEVVNNATVLRHDVGPRWS